MRRKTVRFLALVLAILSVLNVPAIAAAPESARVYRTGNSVGKETIVFRRAGKKKTGNKKKGNKLPKKSVTGKIDNAVELEDGDYLFQDGDYTVSVKGSSAVSIPKVTVKNGRATATVKISDASRKILDAGGKLHNASKSSGGVVFYGVPVAPGRTVQMIAFSKKNAVKLSVTVTFAARTISEEETGEEPSDEEAPPSDVPAEPAPAQPTTETEEPAAVSQEPVPVDAGEESATASEIEPDALAEPEAVEAEIPAVLEETADTEPLPIPEKEEENDTDAVAELPESPEKDNGENASETDAVEPDPLTEEDPADAEETDEAQGVTPAVVEPETELPAEEAPVGEEPEIPPEEPEEIPADPETEHPEKPEAEDPTEEMPEEPETEEPAPEMPEEPDADEDARIVENDTDTFTVTISSDSKMFPVESEAVVTRQDDGSYAMRYTMTASAHREYVALGSKEDALAHTIPWYANETASGNSVYTIPVKLDENGNGSVSVTYMRDAETFSNVSTITVKGPLKPSDAAEAVLAPIYAEEPAEEKTYTVTISSDSKMFPVEAEAVVTRQDDGTYAMRYTMTASAHREYVALGSKEDAAAHTIPWYANETASGNSVYTIPVKLDENGNGSVSVTYMRDAETFSNVSTITVKGPLKPSDAAEAVLAPIYAEEPAEEKTFTVTISSDSKMFPVEAEAVVTRQDDGTYAMRYTMTASAHREYVALGSKEDAAAHTIPWYANETASGNSVYTIPVSLDENGNGSVSVTYMRDAETFSNVSTITIQGPLKPTDAEEAVLHPIDPPGEEGDADYSAVDAALAKVPKDLSIYTDESVAALKKAIDAVDRSLGAEDQDKVDAMAKAIEDAIAALVLKPEEPEENGAMVLKEDAKTEYGMMRVTWYEAITDGKKIQVKFKTNHETYAKGIYFCKTGKISKIKKCYMRDKETVFTVTVPYEKKGAKIPMVIMTDKGWKNEQYYFWVPSAPTKTSKKIPDAPMEDCTGEQYDPEDPTDPLDGTTPKIDNSTDLPDGEYKADKFTFSGGSGRIRIYCEKVIVKDGKSYAVISFNSPNYPYIKAAGGKFMTTHGGGKSTATIPVRLDVVNTIIGMTTAMSQPHEITYSIFIHVNPPEGEEEEKPEEQIVPGLVYKSTDENVAAELFRIHRYENGYVVIQVTGAGRVLIVPSGKPVPEALDEDLLVIRQPAANVYVAEKDLYDRLLTIDGAQVGKTVAIAGFDAGEEMISGGAYDSVDFARLVRSRCSFGILPAVFADRRVTGSEEAGSRAELTDEQAAVLGKIYEGFAGLGMPPVVDRAADEQSELARLEWVRVYGILLGCEKQADTLFHSGAKELEDN